MLSRKEMERELMKRYQTSEVWFIDWNYNSYFEDLDNDQITDLYNKKNGQYKDFNFIIVKDLRRQTYGDTVLVVTRENFKDEVYYERQWDPSFNEKGFSNGYVLNSYKDSGNIIRVNEDTVVEEMDKEFFIQENYHAQPYGHVFE